MRPESRRVKMTKKLLCDSLIHFLFQKDIQHVTIKEICNYADINRSTYYRYYQDPFDQLNKIQEELIHELNLHIEKLVNNIDSSLKSASSDYTSCMVEYLEYVQSKRDIIQILLSVFPDNQFLITFVSHIQANLLTLSPVTNNSSRLYDFIFASSGCIGLLVHWLTNDPEMSVNDLAKLMVSYTILFTSKKQQ